MALLHSIVRDPSTLRLDSRNPLGQSDPVPTQVQNVQQTGSASSSVTLSWSAATDADTYNVYVDSVDTPTLTGVTGTSATLTGLTAETPYDVRVSGVNDIGEGELSDPVTMTTEAAIDTSGLLFASNFGTGVQFGSPYGCGSTSCYQDILGVDPETGFDWGTFDLFNGAAGSGLNSGYRGHLITGVSGTNSSNVLETFQNTVATTTGRTGGQTRAANFKNIKNEAGANQNVFGYNANSGIDTERLYARYWIKLEDDLSERMGDWTYSSFWAWKIGTSAYRLTTQIWSQPDKPLFWMVQGDSGATRHFRRFNYDVPVPQGTWAKVEWFFDRSGNGRIWMAINGSIVYNYVVTAISSGAHPLGVSGRSIDNGTFLTVRASPPILRDVWVDEFELWDDFPSDASSH